MFAWAAFAVFGWLWGQGKSLTEGAPEAETHDYRKGDERVRFEIARLPQDKVKATIVAVLP